VRFLFHSLSRLAGEAVVRARAQQDRLRLHVVLDIRGGTPGETDLVVPPSWVDGLK
jgi:hypothetical protein